MNDDKVLIFINEYRYKIDQIKSFRSMKDLISHNLGLYFWLEEISFFQQPMELLEKGYVKSRKVFELHLDQTITDMSSYWRKLYSFVKKCGISNELVNILREIKESEKEDKYLQKRYKYKYQIPEMIYNAIKRVISQLEKNKDPVLKELLKQKIISTYADSKDTYPLPISDNYDELKDRIYYGYGYNTDDPETSLMIIRNPLYDVSFPYSLEIAGESYDDILSGEPAIEDDVEGIAEMLRIEHARLSEFFFEYYFNGKKSRYEQFPDYPTIYEQSEYSISYTSNKLTVKNKGSVHISSGTVYAQLVNLMVKDKDRTISFSEAKLHIKNLNLNDFHRYKVYLNSKFTRAHDKGELRVRLRLIKDIRDKRGNPVFLLSVSEKSLPL